MGWTQQEIADTVGMARQNISEIAKKFSSKEIRNSFKNGKSVEEIAEYHGLELTTAWAIVPIKNLP